MGDAGIADGVFLHGFQQGRLRLGRGAIQLIGEEQVGENRTRLEAEVAVACAVVFFENLGAEDVRGHQVGRELDAAKLERKRLAQGTHQQGLAEPRHPLDQAMAPRQQSDQQLFDHGILADDGLTNRAAQATELLQSGGYVGFGRLGCHGVPAIRRSRRTG